MRPLADLNGLKPCLLIAPLRTGLQIQTRYSRPIAKLRKSSVNNTILHPAVAGRDYNTTNQNTKLTMKKLIIPLSLLTASLCLPTSAQNVTNRFIGQQIATGTKFSNVASGGGGGGDITTGLLVYYTLDDNAGNITIADSSGNSHTGTASANTSVMHSTGHKNGAFTFDGSSQYVDSGYVWSASDHNLTVAAWINFSSPNDNYSIISSYLGFGDGIISLNSDVIGRLSAGLNDSTGSSISVQTSKVGLNDGNWHHVAMTQDGTTLKIYLDGSFDGSASSTSLNGNYAGVHAGDIFVGGSGTGSGRFQGTVDEVRIYNRALSAADITALYAF
jgi:hypothetical protein